MCFLIQRISFIPSAEDFTFISLDILTLVLFDSRSRLHILGLGQLRTARVIELVTRQFTRIL
jgi:hypothetical protein